MNYKRMLTLVCILCTTFLSVTPAYAIENNELEKYSMSEDWFENVVNNAKAINIGVSKEYGNLDTQNQYRGYKFELTKSGRVSFSIEVTSEYRNYFGGISIYRENGTIILGDSPANLPIGKNTVERSFNLYKGTYYAVLSSNDFLHKDGTAQFVMDTNFTDIKNDFSNLHNTFTIAEPLTLNQSYFDMLPSDITYEGRQAAYKVNVTDKGWYDFNIVGKIEGGVQFSAFDANKAQANVIYNGQYVSEVNLEQESSRNKLYFEKPGVYYFFVIAKKEQFNKGGIELSFTKEGSLELSKGFVKIYLMPGYSTTLKYNTNMSGSLKWSTDNSKIATVTQKGTIFGVGAGETTIYARIGGITAMCNVEVVKPFMTITQPNLNLKKGLSSTVKVRPFPTNAKVTFSSTNSSIASVTSTGSIRGIKPGTCRIKVMANGVIDYINVNIIK